MGTLAPMQWEADAAAKAGVTVSLLRFAIAFFASTLVGALYRLVPSVKGAHGAPSDTAGVTIKPLVTFQAFKSAYNKTLSFCSCCRITYKRQGQQQPCMLLPHRRALLAVKAL